MSTRVLVAGDHFVHNGLLVEALGRQTGLDLDIAELQLPWPLEPFGPVAEVNEACDNEDELLAALAGAEICLTQMAPLTRRVIEASPGLRMVGVGRGGPVNVNLDAATEHGIAVTFAPGRNATATAEHTLGMILAAVRRIPQTHADLLAGQWRSDYYVYDRVGPELEDSTVGVVGLGAIGRRVADVLRAFGAKVLAYDPFVSEPIGQGIELVELDELLSRSRIVTLHARATEQTAGLIGAEQLERMPPGSVVVNCARGALLDYDALADSLESGRLFGAAVDVFPEEPLPPDSRLLRAPNLIMTPHLAGASKETAVKAARIIAGDAARYLRGEPLRHHANPQSGTGPRLVVPAAG